MIYLLKFGASFVLPPGIFIVLLALLVIACWRRQQHRIEGAVVQARVDTAQRMAQAVYTAQAFLKGQRTLQRRAHHVGAGQ